MSIVAPYPYFTHYICCMSLIERDEKVIWHPFTAQKNRAPVIPIVSGKGSLLFDESGNEYIDAISSWWVTLQDRKSVV